MGVAALPEPLAAEAGVQEVGVQEVGVQEVGVQETPEPLGAAGRA